MRELSLVFYQPLGWVDVLLLWLDRHAVIVSLHQANAEETINAIRCLPALPWLVEFPLAYYMHRCFDGGLLSQASSFSH